MPSTGDVFTYAYKHVDGQPVHIDVYLPQPAPSEILAPLPAVIYFHGGALTVGNRQSWFPTWLHREHLFPSRLSERFKNISCVAICLRLTHVRTRDRAGDGIHLCRLPAHSSCYRT